MVVCSVAAWRDIELPFPALTTESFLDARSELADTRTVGRNVPSHKSNIGQDNALRGINMMPLRCKALYGVVSTVDVCLTVADIEHLPVLSSHIPQLWADKAFAERTRSAVTSAVSTE